MLRFWLKHFIRSKTYPIKPEVAYHKQENLAKLYALVSWGLFLTVLSKFMKENFPTTTNSYEYAKLLGIQNTKTIKLQGLSLISEENINLTDSQIEEYHENRQLQTQEKIDASRTVNKEHKMLSNNDN